jgi:anaerobic ribonucleoside-triphosphate reductase activating protein
MTIQYLDIIYSTGADGPGLRNTLYVAGCNHRCPGCHNPESWDFTAGQPGTVEELADKLCTKYCDVTISGGDPVYQHTAVTELCKILKERGKNVWLFTGFTYSEVQRIAPELLKVIDVLVDGPYHSYKRDLSRFAGSSNQRILYLSNGEIIKEE